MDTAKKIAQVVLTVLLIAVLVALAGWTAYTSYTVFNKTLAILAAAENLPPDQAIKLHLDAYQGAVKEVTSSPLNTLLIAFVAYVTGRTVGTISYNAAKARSASDAKEFSLTS